MILVAYGVGLVALLVLARGEAVKRARARRRHPSYVPPAHVRRVPPP